MPAAGPAVHARVRGVPAAEVLCQSAALAAVLGHPEDGIQDLQVALAGVAAHLETMPISSGVSSRAMTIDTAEPNTALRQRSSKDPISERRLGDRAHAVPPRIAGNRAGALWAWPESHTASR